MKPIVQLEIGESIKTTHDLTDSKIRFWKYSSECASVGGGMLKGTTFTVAEKCAVAGAMWVKLEIPGRDPPGFLKVSGEELAWNFE
ncbi:hypothetical protein [Methylosinus sporium]|uniref:hypothetical protein n=1 Tax=Methylosinus sporium TaxID=428 RepID=UPI00383BA4DC